MASYAAVASKSVSLEKEISDWMTILSQVTQPPETLSRLVELLRREMEMPPQGFRNGTGGGSSGASAQHPGSGGGHRNFNASSNGPPTNWRGGVSRFPSQTSPSGPSQFHKSGSTSSFGSSTPRTTATQPATPVGRYQSRFKSTGDIQDKILNTVIGNKLNAFTPLTYTDTRDFIYQIMDSGETEFTRDFIEKVFAKATLEDLYCGLFAKLIAEIAHRYPVMYEEMNKYHGEFLKIFDTVQEGVDAQYADLVKERQYRLGYGQFIAELAGLNALEKNQLLSMVSKVMEKIWEFTAEENKNKTVEEFIDCLVRLTTSLRDRSPKFFEAAKGELGGLILEKTGILIARSTPRPSLSNKARFGLMDLRDLVK